MTESHNYSRTCSRRGCLNTPSVILEVAFLWKRGAFCESCSKELIQEQLVKRVISSAERDRHEEQR